MPRLGMLYNQLNQSLPYPAASFRGKAVIVTGSITGLGREAARHIARLGASTLILAVRNIDKGNAAKDDIERSTGCPKDIIQVWPLDLADYSSVIIFAARANKELERIDVHLAIRCFLLLADGRGQRSDDHHQRCADIPSHISFDAQAEGDSTQVRNHSSSDDRFFGSAWLYDTPGEVRS